MVTEQMTMMFNYYSFEDINDDDFLMILTYYHVIAINVS